MKEELIFLLLPDAFWDGYTIQPARVVDCGSFYTWYGTFTHLEEVSPEEKKIILLCRQLDTKVLYKLYGAKKYKTERDFVEKVDGDLSQHIRTYADGVIHSVIREIRQQGLSLYFRKSRLDNLHKKDILRIEAEKLEVSLEFIRTEENLRYRLTLAHGEKEIIPCLSGLKIITIQPGTVIVGNSVFFLPDRFSGMRLKPFLDKDEIIIPAQNEKEYFKKFILKNICNENIKAEGFDILEIEPEKKALLILEKDVSGHPVYELKYKYNNHVIPCSSRIPAIVELKEKDDNYSFYKINRNTDWEKACVEELVTSGLKHGRGGFFYLPEDNEWFAAIEWIRLNKASLIRNGFEFIQEGLPVNYYTGEWQLSFTQETEADWFQLNGVVILEDGEIIPFRNLWSNILAGNPEYLINDNLIFLIPEEWFARYTPVVLFSRKQAGKMLLHRNQFALLEPADAGKVEPVEEVRAEVSPLLKATLRSYQLEGYNWLYNLYRQKLGACLADDMGLGKTIQTIALLLKYKEEVLPRIERSLMFGSSLQPDLFSDNQQEKSDGSFFSTCFIIAPASVVHNWRNELKKFAPSLFVCEYTGPGRTQLRKGLMRWDVVITTYQTLRNDIDFFSLQKFGIVVFDESQLFKNRDSQLHQAISMVRGDHYIALSGTPIENSLNDLWSLMSVINPGLLGSHSTFNNYFIRPINTDINGHRSEALRKLISPFILRRTKGEVLKDLPERTDELILCETDPEQKKIYDEELSKARNRLLERRMLQDKGNNETFGSLQAIMRLRQIANHPRLSEKDYPHSSGKFREIFRMLEELMDTHHKVLLFSDYVTYLDLVAEEMQERDWKYAMLTGSTRKREEVIREFSEDPSCRFFLISLKAGGVGLNLTEADYVFILDPWWNLAAEEQAISRSHRMGQKQAVFVYRFVTAGTLEEKILSIQQQKQKLSDAIISADGETRHPSEAEMEKLILE